LQASHDGLQSRELPPLAIPKTIQGLLEGKVGVVTGASQGIGAATAIAFAQAGAKVVLAARNETALEEIAVTIKKRGGDAFVVETDVTDPSSVEGLVRSTLEKYGRLDVAFNNAGGGHIPRPLADCPWKTTTVRSV
jgi:NAD(P)-dependent dehydrogenase (short-subunit alcohol dehydrogenase family)